MDGFGRGKSSGFENINPLVEELRKSFPSSLLIYKFLDEVISSPFHRSPDATADTSDSKSSGASLLDVTGAVSPNLQSSCDDDSDDVPHNNDLCDPSSTLTLSDILIPFAVRENFKQDVEPPSLQQKSPTSSSVNSYDVSNVYDILLDQLKCPESAGIVKSLQCFEGELRLRARLPETTGTALGKEIHELISRTISQLRLHIMPFPESDVSWCALEKALEAFVVHKVHDIAWDLVVDHESDTFLSNRLCSLRFLSFEHFDLRAPVENSTKWTLAQSKLRDMETMRTPCGKLACLKECIQLVSEVLGKTSSVEPRPAGADEFLSALILLIISVNPTRLASNIEFLQCFHNPKDLHNGEEGYIFTLLISAIHFLKNADAKTLRMKPEDFEGCTEESMRGKWQEIKLESTTSEIVKDEGKQEEIKLGEKKKLPLPIDVNRAISTDKMMVPPLERVPDLPLPHVKELKASQVRLVKPVPLSRDWTFQEHPLLYHDELDGNKYQQSKLARLMFADKTVNELHPSDLPALLEEHHSLVHLCNELLAEKEVILGSRRRS